MDADRFDTLLRLLSETPTRRGALGLLTGSALGGGLGALLGLSSPENAAAHNPLKKCKKINDKGKRKACVKKAKEHNAAHNASNTTLPPVGCPAGTSPCGAGGACILTDLCCKEDADCPEATFGPMECLDGVCDCPRGGRPCPLGGGGWYCCDASNGETCCNDDSCCTATCTVQDRECACPGGSGPCSDEFSGITYWSCCAAGDTCHDDGLSCSTTTCTAANSTHGGPFAYCNSEATCWCTTKIEDGSPVCIASSGGGGGCIAGCETDADCASGELCVDNLSCGFGDVAPGCKLPCA
jgi:hypothetical protein